MNQRLPDAKTLLADRPGIIPQVPEWNAVRNAILSANEKSLTGCRVPNLPEEEAESIAYCLKELGYEAVAYYQEGRPNNGLRNLSINWRRVRPELLETVK